MDMGQTPEIAFCGFLGLGFSPAGHAGREGPAYIDVQTLTISDSRVQQL